VKKKWTVSKIVKSVLETIRIQNRQSEKMKNGQLVTTQDVEEIVEKAKETNYFDYQALLVLERSKKHPDHYLVKLLNFLNEKEELEAETLHLMGKKKSDYQGNEEQMNKEIEDYREKKDLFEARLAAETTEELMKMGMTEKEYGEAVNNAEDFKRMRETETVKTPSNVCREERVITKGYIRNFEDALEVQNQKEIEKLLKSKNRKEILYNVATTVYEEGLGHECSGLINHWDNDHYIRFLFEELTEKTGLPAYWIIEQAVKKVA
jgi:hypothetical protein